MLEKNRKVLLLDFAQQTNTGDDVMQRTLIELCSNNISSDISIATYFGANEFSGVRGDFERYEGYGLPVVGGMINTYFTEGRFGRSFFRVLQALWFAFLLILLLLKIPASFVSKLLTSKQKKTFDIYSQADVVVWNGRNFRGDGRLGEVLKIFELCANPLFCQALGKSVFCVGASVWPLQSGVSRWLMKIAIVNSKTFLVREDCSHGYLCKELGLFESSVLDRIPDLSFFVINQYLEENKEKLHRDSTGVVGLTLIGRRELASDEIYSRYLNAFSKLVSYISDKGNKIRIIPQVTYDLEPYDKELDFIVSQNPGVDLDVVDGELGVEGLLDQYMGIDILMASRMHSAIFARSLGVPVAAVAYDEGAKWCILDDLKVHRSLVLPASALSSEELIHNFDEVSFVGRDSSIPELVNGLVSEMEAQFKKLVAVN